MSAPLVVCPHGHCSVYKHVRLCILCSDRWCAWIRDVLSRISISSRIYTPFSPGVSELHALKILDGSLFAPLRARRVGEEEH